jgi:hypothetical protein
MNSSRAGVWEEERKPRFPIHSTLAEVWKGKRRQLEIPYYASRREIHKKYTLYQCSWGDCFLSILPDAIKTIGLFDESMCSLGYYEADFLLRAWLHNREKTTINDFYHYRMLNITTTVATRIDRKPGDARGYRYQDHSAKVFSTKWPGVEANGWYHSLFRNPPTGPATPVFMNYPYFEYDVEDLEKKGFVVR